MTLPPSFTPIELALLVDCSLQYHFWRQTALPLQITPASAVLETIQRLHAAGGPQRKNLPATLRDLAELTPAGDPRDQAVARQMIANYHRRLREEWPGVIAANEQLSLSISLPRGTFLCETVIDRIDREADGGVTAIELITIAGPVEPFSAEDNIEATMRHALTAAAYPHKRPVRLSRKWLWHDQAQLLQLAEQEYRRNLQRVKERVIAWLGGEILARPGLHCQTCAFKYNGCPLYLTENPQDDRSDLPKRPPPATLSQREWTEEDNFEQTETDT